MSYVVYADVMLIWIFTINYLTYYITCKITNYRISQMVLIIWSLISSLILEFVHITCIFTNNQIFKALYILVNVALFFLFLKLVIKINCSISIIKMLCYNILGILLLAGVYMVFNNSSPNIKILPPIILIICFIFPLILKLYPISSIKNKYQVQIHTNNKIINTYGYMDTGNTLIDIYSNKPVIILDYRLIREIISKKEQYELENYVNTGNYQYISNLKIDGELLHPICYKTISNDCSIIPAFKIKLLVLNKKYISKNIVAAISQRKLSNTDDYMVLLNNNL